MHLGEHFLLDFDLLSPALCPESSLDVQISTANKVYLQLLQPYLSVMLRKGSLEVFVYTGSNNPRRVIRLPEQGTLNDGREHLLRIERLPDRLVCVCSSVQFVFPTCATLIFVYAEELLHCIINFTHLSLCIFFVPDHLQYR